MLLHLRCRASVKGKGAHTCCDYLLGLQWNLSDTDTLGTKIIVLISEVSLFQGENNYKIGTQSSVQINQVSIFQGCTSREVPS